MGAGFPDDWCRPVMSTMGGMAPNRGISGEGILLRLVVDVRPAFRPSRSAWCAVDCDSGEIVEYAFEYDSPLAARHAGLERLTGLGSSLDEAPGAPWRLHE